MPKHRRRTIADEAEQRFAEAARCRARRFPGDRAVDRRRVPATAGAPASSSSRAARWAPRRTRRRTRGGRRGRAGRTVSVEVPSSRSIQDRRGGPRRCPGARFRPTAGAGLRMSAEIGQRVPLATAPVARDRSRAAVPTGAAFPRAALLLREVDLRHLLRFRRRLEERIFLERRTSSRSGSPETAGARCCTPGCARCSASARWRCGSRCRRARPSAG